MNSIAQHAVPNGIGQSEFDCAHWTAMSSFVVRKSAPDDEGMPGPSGGWMRRSLHRAPRTLVKSVTRRFYVTAGGVRGPVCPPLAIRGSRMRNVVPRPGWLSTWIVPPCSSTNAFASARPMPMPR